LKEFFRELKSLGIILEGNFTHGRGDEWIAAPRTNQFLDFDSTPTFEGENA